jgi:hypothetical protein
MRRREFITIVTIVFCFGVGLRADSAWGQKIYWLENYYHGKGPTHIRRANLDGTNPEVVLTAELASPRDVALDWGAGKLYWSEGGGRIRRSNLDGSNAEVLVDDAGAATGLALDLGAAKVY